MNLSKSTEFSNYLKTTTLSPREVEVVLELMKGHPAKRIGHNLYLASTTVQTHLQRIRKKLDAQNNVHIVVKFLHQIENPIKCLRKVNAILALTMLSIVGYMAFNGLDADLRKPNRTHRIKVKRKDG